MDFFYTPFGALLAVISLLFLIGTFISVYELQKFRKRRRYAKKEVLYYYTYKYHLWAIVPLVLFCVAFPNMSQKTLEYCEKQKKYCEKQKKECYVAIKADLDSLAVHNAYIEDYHYDNIFIEGTKSFIDNGRHKKSYDVDVDWEDESGWLIAMNCVEDTSLSSYLLYPNRVVLSEEEEDEAINITKMNRCINEAYLQIAELATSETSCFEDFKTSIKALRNEYYSIKVDTTDVKTKLGRSNTIDCKSDFGVTYITRQPFYTFQIVENQEKQATSKANKLTLIGQILLVAMLIISLFNVYTFAKTRKMPLQNIIHKRLIIICNPSNFMKPYDKEKVEVANSLMSLLIETNPHDGCMKQIEETAQEKLGIVIIGNRFIRQLKRFVHPKRFLKPYNPSKFALANELYTKVSSKGLSLHDIKEVDLQAAELL